jgi:hypothetical protein
MLGFPWSRPLSCHSGRRLHSARFHAARNRRRKRVIPAAGLLIPDNAPRFLSKVASLNRTKLEHFLIFQQKQ